MPCVSFEHALVLDPKNIEAMVGAAMVDGILGTNFMTDDRAVHLARAEATVSKVLSRSPNHSVAHWILGGVLSSVNRVAQGIAECERALTLNPNLADAHAQIGLTKLYMGRGMETEAHVNEAIRISPRDVSAYRWLAYAGQAKLVLNQNAEAIFLVRSQYPSERKLCDRPLCTRRRTGPDWLVR